MATYKQVILCREDLKLSPGKLAAQAAHASVESLLRSHKDITKAWHEQGMKKIVLRVKNKEELMDYKVRAEIAGLIIGLVVDAGMTELPPGTITCLGIGPDKEEKIDKITGNLHLYSE